MHTSKLQILFVNNEQIIYFQDLSPGAVGGQINSKGKVTGSLNYAEQNSYGISKNISSNNFGGKGCGRGYSCHPHGKKIHLLGIPYFCR